MSNVLTLKTKDEPLRAQIAQQLREMAALVETQEAGPIAYAAVVFSEAPWDGENESMAFWHVPWPKAVACEAVKLQLLSSMNNLAWDAAE